jgi:hypothetical protein
VGGFFKVIKNYLDLVSVAGASVAGASVAVALSVAFSVETDISGAVAFSVASLLPQEAKAIIAPATTKKDNFFILMKMICC